MLLDRDEIALLVVAARVQEAGARLLHYEPDLPRDLLATRKLHRIRFGVRV
jgi:hypothetical protein